MNPDDPDTDGTAAADSRSPVLVVDDHELFADMVVLFLRRRGFETHRCPPTSGPDILAAAAALPPGLVLLDLDLGADGSGRPIVGTELIGDLCADGWTVIALTGHLGQDGLAASVAAGASGVLLKSSPLDRMVDLVERAVSGRALMDPSERRSWFEQHRSRSSAASALAMLTPREREVLERLARGERAQAIATSSGVALATVRTHIRAVLAKLEVNSQIEAVACLKGGR